MKRRILGPRAVTEAVRAHPGSVHVVYIDRRALKKAHASLAREAGGRGVKVEPRDTAALDELARGKRHQGVVALAGEYSYVSLDELLLSPAPLLVALDQITDPHNFGAIVRSAVAFGADGVITLKDRAAPVTPVVVRASAGATEHARITRVVNLARTLASLADRGLSVVGLDADGESTVAALPEAPLGRVLVVGAEGKGLRRLVRERCTTLARIEQVGPVASLNASVAASVALYAASRDR